MAEPSDIAYLQPSEAGCRPTLDTMTPHWFEELASHMGPAYLRYSFTKGTEQEVGFLVDHLGLTPGTRVADIGCGPGRHAHALAARGIHVVGLDISDAFIRQAAVGAPAVRGDARRLPFTTAFDAAISLCQGGFGLTGGPAAAGMDLRRVEPDEVVMGELARIVRPGGAVVVSAFSSYFAVRHQEEGETFHAASGIQHETMTVRNEAGDPLAADGWTTCYTPRELRLLARGVGLSVEDVFSVTPGAYGTGPPDLDQPEYLAVLRRE